MAADSYFVVVALDEQRFALPVAAVDRVVRAVYVTPLPDAPPIVVGIVNVQGVIVPVLNLRQRCGLIDRPIELDHQLVIAHTSRRTVGFIVDSCEVIGCAADELIPVDQIATALDFSQTVFKRSDEMIMVYDLDSLMSGNDELSLGGAIVAHHAAGVAS